VTETNDEYPQFPGQEGRKSDAAAFSARCRLKGTATAPPERDAPQRWWVGRSHRGLAGWAEDQLAPSVTARVASLRLVARLDPFRAAEGKRGA
jgi:hypothetical protein